MQPRGYVLYRGPSQLTDEPIVMIALAHSVNDKTGDVVQTYILVDDERPTAALKSGADEAICGDCKQRPANSGGCYVVVRQGATRVWQCYKNGDYPELSDISVRLPFILENRTVRMGAYGDPAAVPIAVWDALLAHAGSWIGYTHQWHMEVAQPLKKYCMASVDTPTEKAVANLRGWRSFRVRLEGEGLVYRESVCPASEEAGHKVNCIQCGACDGAGSGKRGNIAIIVHGAKGPHQPVARYTKWRGDHDAA